MEVTSTCGFLCAEGWEEALCREVSAIDPAAAPRSPVPGIVLCAESPAIAAADLAFARQHLPCAIEVTAPSVKKLVQALGAFADETVGAASIPWCANVTTPDPYTLDGAAHRSIEARSRLISDGFFERMRTYRRRTFERLRPWPTDPPKEPLILLQAIVAGHTRLALSASERRALPGGRSVPSLWPGGPRVPEDPHAPCRSYYKIEEAWLEAGAAPGPGDRCVDLGAAPGGWTYAGLKRGARVLAVDFVDLAPAIEHHALCEHSRDNGYEYMPPERVDWLFCDMIVRPLATLGLLERWLAAKRCDRFVANLKFRGKNPAELLAAARDLGRRHGLAELLVRHLYYDRNEVTLIGKVAATD